MANTKSAKKAARQATRRTAVNKTRRTRLKSSVRKVEEAIATGKADAGVGMALRWLKPLIESLNAFGIKRGTADVGAIKETLRRLKDGAAITVFPEATRTAAGSRCRASCGRGAEAAVTAAA